MHCAAHKVAARNNKPGLALVVVRWPRWCCLVLLVVSSVVYLLKMMGGGRSSTE
jgi:hypothetical protein